jgi:hypothetical protein
MGSSMNNENIPLSISFTELRELFNEAASLKIKVNELETDLKEEQEARRSLLYEFLEFKETVGVVISDTKFNPIRYW